MVDVIGVESVEDHDDGSATFTVVVDENARTSLANEGLKLILYCAAADMDVQLVYDFIEDHIRYNNDQKIRPMTDEERQAAKKRAKANQKDKKSQHNTTEEEKTQ